MKKKQLDEMIDKMVKKSLNEENSTRNLEKNITLCLLRGSLKDYFDEMPQASRIGIAANVAEEIMEAIRQEGLI